MLSVGEIVAIDMEHLRFALWPNTTTVQGLRLNGKANIVFVYDIINKYNVRFTI